MRALIWIVPDTWEATVAEAAAVLPAEAEVTVLVVAPADAEELARGARHGLLGRHPPPHAPLRAVSDEEAAALLRDAAERLGRDAELVARRGRVEREVVAAAAEADLSCSRATATAAGRDRRASARRRATWSTTRPAACCSCGRDP